MKKLAFIGLLLALLSCKNEAVNQKLNPAQWILGTWELKNEKGILTETWVRQNDSTFAGTFYFINVKDTLHKETIRLEHRADSITYFAKVIGQNNDKSIPFKLTTASIDSLIFENPAHDYPQKMVYQKNKTNGIIITLSGQLQGKQRSEKYKLTKQ